MNSFEPQYLDLMRRIMAVDGFTDNRTGNRTKKAWGVMIPIDLSEGFPMVTTRKTAFRVAFEETMEFLRGHVDTNILVDKKINIWKGNTTREFLDKRGLTHLPEGNMGKGYGFQWRHFGGELTGDDYTVGVGGVDQVREVLEGLKNDPYGRRHIILAWNPLQTAEMALPPCHLYQQFDVKDGKLNSSFMMRSWDVLYGAPFNIMGYAFINMAFAKYLGLEPGVMNAFGNDIHLYEDQLEIAAEQVTRTPMALPKMTINKELNSLEDILSLQFSDITIDGYEAHPDFKNKPGMAV